MGQAIKPGSALDSVLAASDHPEVEKAVEELNQLRAVQAHLVTHFVAVRRQNDVLHSALQEPSLFSKL